MMYNHKMKAKIYGQCANVLYSLGRHNDALDHYGRAWTAAGSNDSVLKGQLLVNSGDALVALDLNTEAVVRYTIQLLSHFIPFYPRIKPRGGHVGIS